LATPNPAPEHLSLPVRWSAAGHQRLDSILLNGRAIAAVSPERTHYEIALDSALVRNMLVLELETPPASPGGGAKPEWGLIALVIRPIENPAAPRGPY
jgi:hypothetical protein